MDRDAADAPAGRRAWGGRVRAAFVDPAMAFAVIGAVVGVTIAVLAPSFTGIDEASHFARSVRISEGSLIADAAPPGITDAQGTGAGHCLLRPLLHQIALAVVAEASPGTSWSEEDSRNRFPRCDDADDRGFYTAATHAWYSPLGYVPQAVAVKVGDVAGAGASTQLLLARLATLATYLVLVTVAIRRAPTGRWALAAVALLPVALYEAATSVSPDAFTTAMVIFVVSSAMRGAARPERVGTGAFVAESVLAAVALGLAKPTYVVFALAYAIPLLRRPWPRRWATLALPAVVGGAVSALWYRSQQGSFSCDVAFFTISPDPDRQLDSLLHGPQQLVGAAAQAIPAHGSGWTVDLFAVGETVAPQIAGVAVVVGIVLFALAGAQRTATERYVAPLVARVYLFALAIVGYLGVLGGWLVYCSAPTWEVLNPPHPRLLLPVLVVVAVAVAPSGARASRLGRSTIPLALGIVAVDLWFVWSFGATVRS